jgi:hypothetical protein
MDDLGARLEGRWLNTLATGQVDSIDHVVVRVVGERAIEVLVVAVSIPGLISWGRVRCEVFECWEEDQVRGAAALGRIEHIEDTDVELQLRVNKGILCVMRWTRFRDPGQNPWVTRELFARALDGGVQP